MPNLVSNLGPVALAVGLALGTPAPAHGQQTQKRPNILVIWGDDVGVHNISAYSHGIMGYQTPSIDRIAREGALFTDAYAQQSCTAGRASFILGQHPFRTGLLTIGMPGSPQGIPEWAPTIADLLKQQGYATGQFGKNHLGDQDEHLPTNHGFDEFFGNLYHLNAEEEPETYYYPKDPEFRKKYGPRGVLHTWSDGKGGQRIEDTGPLTSKRMETVDQEILAAADKFIVRTVKEKKPFFVWFNTTRMHVWTHLKPSAQGRTGIGLYPDGMVEHDDMVGGLLKRLDELGIADNTIVVYGTDNGAEVATWPDGGMMPFKGEKGTTWEGGLRVPMLVRWPGVIRPGTIVNDIGSHEDMLPTLLAAAGDATVKDDLRKGRTIGAMNYKVHLDGYDLGPALKGAAPWPRNEFIYWTDDGSVAALRYAQWKMVFLEQRGHGFDVWQEPFVQLRLPKLFNLRSDPFERADHEGMGYPQWRIERAFLIAPAGAYVANWLQSFRDFPPRQKPGSFNLDRVMEAVSKPAQ